MPRAFIRLVITPLRSLEYTSDESHWIQLECGRLGKIKVIEIYSSQSVPLSTMSPVSELIVIYRMSINAGMRSGEALVEAPPIFIRVEVRLLALSCENMTHLKETSTPQNKTQERLKNDNRECLYQTILETHT